MIQNEVAILRRVKHPNIVLLIEEVDTYSELYLVMELVKVCGRILLSVCVIMSVYASAEAERAGCREAERFLQID